MKQLAFGFQHYPLVDESKRSAVGAFIHAIGQRLCGHVQVVGIFFHRMHGVVMMLQHLAETDKSAVCRIINAERKSVSSFASPLDINQHHSNKILQ